jgi:hypothetical protein
MTFFTFLAPAFVLVLLVMPVLLIRRPTHFGAKDDFVSSDHIVPKVIQNSSIAYGVGLAALGPLLTWGASGDLRPAIIYTISVGAGLSIIYTLRRPILKFLADALHYDRSITVHAFICRRHGDDPRVRTIAAVLTMSALAGLVVCEMLAVATVLKPLVSDSTVLTELSLAAVLFIVTLCAMWSGHAGTMHATQLQLGLLYLGLFGSTAFLLYLQMSELGVVPARGRFAIALVAFVCIFLIIYRRVRYVDTRSLHYNISNADATVRDRETLPSRLVSRFSKILNVFIATFVGLALGFSAVELYVAGVPVIAHDGVTLLTDTHLLGMALIVFILRALFHPIVDVVNWQRLAAFENQRDWRYSSEHQWASELKRFCMAYAVEVPLIVLLIALFATIAGLSSTSEPANVVQAFIVQLAAQDNFVATIVVSLFLFSLFAMAVSTMSSLLVANLCTIRYDIMPMFWPKPTFAQTRSMRRLMIVAGASISVVVFALFCLADARYQITLTSGSFLALVLGFSSPQMSLAPLVLGPLIDRSSRGGAVSPRWAVAVMAVGTTVGSGMAAAYLTTGYEPWLWAALPGCLGSGILLFIVAPFLASAQRPFKWSGQR